ncbi:MAG: hypothetical protein COS32_03715, partial [Sulfurimonas sp. CG02_land_8_20_14_3_00_36_67]
MITDILINNIYLRGMKSNFNMVSDKHLNVNGRQLCRQLSLVRSEQEQENKGRLVNVAGVGEVVSTAYEQLRNAAEYAQEHLLIQNAIRRFFMRNLSFNSHNDSSKVIAEELIIELTQSGYIKNNTQPVEIVGKLDKIIHNCYTNYWCLKASGVDDSVARSWTLDLSSLYSENMLVEDKIQNAFVQFTFNHYRSILDKKLFIDVTSTEDTYEVSLYIAIHRALLKSDIASVRYDMQKLYDVSDSNINNYAQFHR